MRLRGRPRCHSPGGLAAVAQDALVSARRSATWLPEVNASLPAAERVRRFTIAAEPFSLTNMQLTPTLKIRRHAIREVYQPAFETLYDGTGMAA